MKVELFEAVSILTRNAKQKLKESHRLRKRARKQLSKEQAQNAHAIWEEADKLEISAKRDLELIQAALRSSGQ